MRGGLENIPLLLSVMSRCYRGGAGVESGVLAGRRLAGGLRHASFPSLVALAFQRSLAHQVLSTRCSVLHHLLFDGLDLFSPLQIQPATYNLLPRRRTTMAPSDKEASQQALFNSIAASGGLGVTRLFNVDGWVALGGLLERGGGLRCAMRHAPCALRHKPKARRRCAVLMRLIHDTRWGGRGIAICARAMGYTSRPCSSLPRSHHHRHRH